MGIDIVFMGNPERIGIEDPTCGCFPARAMIEYLPDSLHPMSHLPWREDRACPHNLRDYVERLREFTRYRDPTWALNHPKWMDGVYAVRSFIRIAKKYLEHDIGAYISY